MAQGTLEGLIPRPAEERDPPSFSARALEPLTRSFFKEAGLARGMHVLDVWSGAGDLTFLVQDIVGPDGQVTGVEQNAPMLEYARERAEFRRLGNVAFVNASLDALPFDRDFDAVVGRLVLMHRPKPDEDLRSLCRYLREGGIVAFQELDLLAGRTVPPAPLINQVLDWLNEAYVKAGIDLEMGPKLYQTFKSAGLRSPEMRADSFIGGAESICPALLANVASMLVPEAKAMDLLEERLRSALVQTGGVMSTPLLIGAWTRLAH